jgi:hypothetical protein
VPLTRVVAIALLLFPLTAIAQSMPSQATPAQTPATSRAPSSEPWRVLPNDISKPVSPPDSLTQWQAQHANLLNRQDPGILRIAPPVSAAGHLAESQPASPDGQLLDTTCYAIRSYVFARDRQDSDSTHLVDYSTCQPASRYRLKTIQLQADPPSR